MQLFLLCFFLIAGAQEAKKKQTCFEHSVDCSQKIHVTGNFVLDFYLPRDF